MQTHYDILGISPEATTQDIKAAYRHLAKTLHPDRAQGDRYAEEQFKALSEAYRVLGHPLRRRHYDATRKMQHPTPENMVSALQDIAWGVWENFTGHSKPRRDSQQRGHDHHYVLHVDVPMAVLGGDMPLHVLISEACTLCLGSGCASGHSMQPCPVCGASGTLQMRQGLFTLRKTCTTCHGRGAMIQVPCNTCKGIGRGLRETTMRVKIPPRTRHGTVLRYAGMGSPGPHGRCGDLRVTVHVNPHPIFEYRNDKIMCQHAITFSEAALGGTVDIVCIDGSTRPLVISPGTQSESMVLLKNPPQGIAHHVRLLVRTPQAIDAEAQNILHQLKRIETLGLVK